MTGSMSEDGRPRMIDPMAAPDDGDGTALSIDEICHLLQNQRRRGVLRYLRETNGDAEMSDIAEAIAAVENDTTVKRLDHDERKRVYIALYQTHLPKLDDSGIIEYDRERGNVAATAAAERLYEAMDAVSPGDTTDFDPAARPTPTTDSESNAAGEPGLESEGDDEPESNMTSSREANLAADRQTTIYSSASAVVLSGLAAALGVGIGRSALPVVAGLLLASTSHFAVGTIRDQGA